MLAAHISQVFEGAPTTVEYLPAAQESHATSAVAVLYLPATHLVHSSVLVSAVHPALHSHDAIEPLPTGDPWLAGQSTQLVYAASLYVPAEQFSQVSKVAPTTMEYLPAAQESHTMSAVAVLYLPATHAVHSSVLVPAVHPALHLQDAIELLVAGDERLAGHAKHVSRVEVAYVSAGQ